MFDMSLPFGLKKQLNSQRSQLYRLAMSWCGDKMLADDLVQECLIKAWKKRHQLKDENKLNAWMFKILNNCWMEYLRKSKSTTDLDQAPVDLVGGPEQDFAQKQLADSVRAAVYRLPIGQRQVVTLVDLQELRYAEVAEILEIPVGTVMSRLSRGRKALREELLQVHAQHTEIVLRRVK